MQFTLARMRRSKILQVVIMMIDITHLQPVQQSPDCRHYVAELILGWRELMMISSTQRRMCDHFERCAHESIRRYEALRGRKIGALVLGKANGCQLQW